MPLSEGREYHANLLRFSRLYGPERRVRSTAGPSSGPKKFYRKKFATLQYYKWDILVFFRTWSLLRDTTHILLQGVPRGFDLKEIRLAMGDVQGVAGVHDLHLWSVAGDDASLTAHVALIDGSDAELARRAVTELLETRFNIHHATIQTETDPCGDEESLHK